MNQPAHAGDKLIYVDPSPIARRLLWHLFSIGSRRMIQTDRHGRFEKPGAHLFWLQSGEGELEYRSSRFELKRGKKVWLGDMGKPRTYIPAPGRHLAITGFRFGGPGLEFWHEEFNADENAEFTLDDFNVFTRMQSELLRLVRRRPIGWEWQVHLRITEMFGRLLISRELLVSPSTQNCRRRSCASSTPSPPIRSATGQLSFSSEFYFSHFFRHHTGMTPTEFRRHLKG